MNRGLPLIFIRGKPYSPRVQRPVRNKQGRSYGHGPKYCDYMLVIGVTPFLQEPPDNYQEGPVLFRYQIFVTLFGTVHIWAH